MTHLYAGAAESKGDDWKMFLALTACGLRKPYQEDRLPPDVVDRLGAVTCPSCREKGEAMAQQGKKAQ